MSAYRGRSTIPLYSLRISVVRARSRTLNDAVSTSPRGSLRPRERRETHARGLKKRKNGSCLTRNQNFTISPYGLVEELQISDFSLHGYLIKRRARFLFICNENKDFHDITVSTAVRGSYSELRKGTLKVGNLYVSGFIYMEGCESDIWHGALKSLAHSPHVRPYLHWTNSDGPSREPLELSA